MNAWPPKQSPHLYNIFFLKFMLDHSYFNATFFRSLFIYSIYQIPDAHERKITLSLHDPNYLCTIFAYYSSWESIFPQRMLFPPSHPSLPASILITISACKLLARLTVYAIHQVLLVPSFKVSRQKYQFIFTFYFSSRLAHSANHVSFYLNLRNYF